MNSCYQFRIIDAYDPYLQYEQRWFVKLPAIGDVISVGKISRTVIEVDEDAMRIRVIFFVNAADALRSDFYGERNRCRYCSDQFFVLKCMIS